MLPQYSLCFTCGSKSLFRNEGKLKQRMRDPVLQVIIPMVFVHLKSINIFTRVFWPWLPTLHWCQGQGYPGPTCGHEMDPVSSTKAATDPTKPSNPSTPEWVVCCRTLIFHPGVPVITQATTCPSGSKFTSLPQPWYLQTNHS